MPKRVRTKTRTLTIRLSNEEDEAIRSAAAREMRTPGDYARYLIMRSLTQKKSYTRKAAEQEK
jgi:uncharacterized protein (DUF1778 family)